MKTKDKQKICINCDARIPIETDQCPFCAYSSASAFNQSLSSLYTPPYSANRHIEERAEPVPVQTHSLAPSHTEGQKAFWPLLLLLFGGNLLTIGLLQFFFSDRGKLTLQWDSSYWFLYCLIALPLFYFGFKKAVDSE